MKQFLTLILLFSAGICLSQEKFVFTDSAVTARFRHDVYGLASDSMNGRLSGTAGERIASGFLEKCFREAGLSPAGKGDSTYLQPFYMEHFVVKADSSSLFIEGYHGTTIPRYDFCPAACSENGRMRGRNYALIDLARFRKLPGNFTGGPGDSAGEAIRSAFLKGFSAVILCNEGSLNRSDLRRMYDRTKTSPGLGVVISVNPYIASYLEKHPGTDLFTRVRVSRVATCCHNVVGKIDNKAPYTIIIGAHYDHLGISRRHRVFNGADDNASGTAVMVELARYLRQSGDKGYNYLFVAFSGEEEGLYGSDYFAGHLPVAPGTVDCMVNLDMVGRLGCEGNRITAFGTGTSPMWRTLYKETPHPGFRVCRFRGVHAFTDHLAFYRQGIPILSFTTGDHYEYHTSSDDPWTINYTGMTQVVHYLEALIHQKAITGKAGFRKPSGWFTFTVNLKIILNAIDYVLTSGVEQ